MKVTVSGVCRDALERSETELDLATIHALCVKAGLNVEPAQVYAGLQSMASTGKCDRGSARQTWIKLGAGRGAAEPKVRTKIEKRTFATADIIADLTTALGDPVPRPKQGLAHCFVLLGDYNAQHILDRTYIVLGGPAGSWFTYPQADNIVVGFTL